MKKLIMFFLLLLISSSVGYSQDEPNEPYEPFSNTCTQWIGECTSEGNISRTGNVAIGGSGTDIISFPFPPKLALSADATNHFALKTLGSVVFSANGTTLPALTAVSYNGGLVGDFLGDIRIQGDAEMDNLDVASINTFKLFVEGIAYAKAIKVKLPPFPPDYVFASDYDLMPLKDLEKYLKENKHLPNVPSAKEMEEEGTLNLGEFQFKNLEKIEELTLYIIELNNKILELEKEVNNLKK